MGSPGGLGLPGSTLVFREPLQGLSTRVGGGEALSGQGRVGFAQLQAFRPDWLQNLSFQRSAVQAWMASTSDKLPSAELLDGLFSYACCWHGFAQQVPADLRDYYSEWVSALAGGRHGGRPFRLNAPLQELAMLYATYGAALRERAHLVLADAGAAGLSSPMATSDGGATSAGDASGAAAAPATAAVGLLRRAAGVYVWLSSTLEPSLPAYAGPDNTPAELRPGVAAAMASLCLGEAQALLTARAAEKSSSFKTLSSLHAGVAELFGEAAAFAARPDTPMATTSPGAAAPPLQGPAGGGAALLERLGRYLSVSALFQQGLAVACQAADFKASMELGSAEVCAMVAEKLFGDAQRAAGSEAGWKATIAAEHVKVVALRLAANKDRLSVTYQSLPVVPPPLGPSRVLAVAIEFVPQPVLPPPAAVPLPNARGNQGCAVQ